MELSLRTEGALGNKWGVLWCTHECECWSLMRLSSTHIRECIEMVYTSSQSTS